MLHKNKFLAGIGRYKHDELFKCFDWGMCIASSKFSMEKPKELRSRREQPLATLVNRT